MSPGPHPEGISRPTPGGISQHALRQAPLQADGYWCGFYASYWNAFLSSNVCVSLSVGIEVGFAFGLWEQALVIVHSHYVFLSNPPFIRHHYLTPRQTLTPMLPHMRNVNNKPLNFVHTERQY